MTASRSGNNGSAHLECPECGAELLLQRTGRLFRLAADRPSHSSGSTERSLDLGMLDEDQSLSDRDQTTSDSDQTASDGDQTGSDHDEKASADDQEASDADLAAGGDQAEHDRSRTARKRASGDRRATSKSRDDTGVARVRIAGERDRIAESRDRGAAGRTRLAANLDHQATALDLGLDDHSVSNRVAAAESDRAAAAIDRRRAGEDREAAMSLRAAAALDREEAVRERDLAGIDELTGVNLRRIGLEAVKREIERSRRTEKRLVLAFVDVNNLKTVNDDHGHLAGDALLRRVAQMLKAKLRPYDVIVRFGGDEFVCALPTIALEAVARRFSAIVAALESNGDRRPISFGLAELAGDDDLERLLKRADDALIATRRLVGHRSARV